MIDFCCEEGQKTTGGLCWKHTHQEITILNPEIERRANEPDVIPAKQFEKLIRRTRKG